MNEFAALLDRLGFEPSRLGKLRLMTAYFRTTPDPERGYALAALTGARSFQHAKPGLIRALISERVDPYLFDLSYDYVGDLSETVALLWPAPQRASEPASNHPALTLAEVVHARRRQANSNCRKSLPDFSTRSMRPGAWALLKLITGALRIGVSARLAKLAVAELGGKHANEIEDIWHGLAPPYIDLFAWLEGREEKARSRRPC